VLNLGHARWLHPCEGCAACTDSVPELFEDAVAAAAQALEDLPRNRHAVGDASLSLTAPDAGRCTPSRFSPLPVAALLALHLESLTSLHQASAVYGTDS
jgi:ferredoxin